VPPPLRSYSRYPVLVRPPLVARNGKGAAPTAGQTDWYFRLEPAHG
jgi:hypothetical protein